ncbi:MAG: hypothetical protein GY725_20735, partial [bacterium]|nr:hypothetical protein [bacterium]
MGAVGYPPQRERVEGDDRDQRPEDLDAGTGAVAALEQVLDAHQLPAQLGNGPVAHLTRQALGLEPAEVVLLDLGDLLALPVQVVPHAHLHLLDVDDFLILGQLLAPLFGQVYSHQLGVGAGVAGDPADFFLTQSDHLECHECSFLSIKRGGGPPAGDRWRRTGLPAGGGP